MRLYNTLSKQIEDFTPLKNSTVKMYACGLTPYDYSHLGHAMQGIVFDIIRRYLEFKNYEVIYVRNYTDIDDKIIKAASDHGVDPLDWSREMIESAEKDFKNLDIAPATHTPLVSDNISQIIELIQLLLSKDFAYSTHEGNIYFKTRHFSQYGKLSHQNIEKLLQGTRKEVEPDKQDARDFALWKVSKPGEPEWQSPWGKGRPGWHIECSVMSKRHLGETFDIHGGGIDLIFPHHENEIAQSEAAHGKPFAMFWMHNGMMTLRGEKMSKSTKNYVLIHDALKEFHSQTIRYLVLTNHYRSDQDYSQKRFRDGQMRVYYYYKTLLKHSFTYTGTINPESRWVRTFIEYMDNDLDSVQVFSLLDGLFKQLNSGQLAVHEKAALFEFINVVGKVFGILNKNPRHVVEEIKLMELEKYNTSEDMVAKLIQAREAARKNGDFAKADMQRNDLVKLGVVISDIGNTTDWDPIFASPLDH